MKRVTVKMSHWIILNSGQSKTINNSYTFEIEDDSDEKMIFAKALSLFKNEFEKNKKDGIHPHADIEQIAPKDQSYTIE